LGQYQLPQSFYELTSSSAIPDSYLNRIIEFQKKGAIQNFDGIISAVAGLRENCVMMIKDT
jgi:hypothetical protein